jgi:sirohydrochlorin cobaltochelatase
MKRGLLLFAHGARDPRWALPFEDVARRARHAEPSLAVELAFLEFMSPDLLEAGARLARAGCERVDTVPLFLGAGGHVRKDIPELMDRLRGAHPQVQWRLHRAIGELDAVVEAMARQALALARDDEPPVE